MKKASFFRFKKINNNAYDKENNKNFTSCIIYLLFNIAFETIYNKKQDFLKDLMKYRPYEVEGMLIEEFSDYEYFKSTSIVESDNSKLENKCKFIIENFETLMIKYFEKKTKK